MRKIVYAVGLMIGLAMLPACHGNNNDDDAARRQDSLKAVMQDSINTAQAERDSLMNLVSEVADGIAQIKELEDIISTENLNNETPDRKQQLSNDILLIQQSINKQKQRVADMERRLKQSTNYDEKMEKIIASLKQQLEQQQQTIDRLTKELAAAHIQIKNLNQSVDSLNTVNKEVTKEKEAVEEHNKNLTSEVDNLNNCYYVIGSSKELKQHKIIEKRFLGKTKILEGDFEMSYFTKADRRTLSEIPLHSKKAQVLTNQPKDSYEIVDHGGSKSLRITNAAKFWEKSNFLVIKIN